MVFTVGDAIEIKADHLTKMGGDEKLFFSCRVVNGRRFLPVTKTRLISRLFVGDDNITNTTFVETLRDLRNTAAWKEIYSKCGDTVHKGKVGPKRRPRDMRSKWLLLEDTISMIEVPAMSPDIPGRQIAVLLGKPGSAAPCVEVTQGNLQYMMDVAVFQIASEPRKKRTKTEITDGDDMPKIATRGVSYIYKDHQLVGILAKRPTASGGGKTTKSLMLKNLGSVEACVAAAEAFMADVSSGSASNAIAAAVDGSEDSDDEDGEEEDGEEEESDDAEYVRNIAKEDNDEEEYAGTDNDEENCGSAADVDAINGDDEMEKFWINADVEADKAEE